MIREIKPDFILSEKSPDRCPMAQKEFDVLDTIMDPLVRVFARTPKRDDIEIIEMKPYLDRVLKK